MGLSCSVLKVRRAERYVGPRRWRHAAPVAYFSQGLQGGPMDLHLCLDLKVTVFEGNGTTPM
jgi:hypothetical protein